MIVQECKELYRIMNGTGMFVETVAKSNRENSVKVAAEGLGPSEFWHSTHFCFASEGEGIKERLKCDIRE